MNRKINIPKFRDEDEERDFWSRIDVSEYLEKKDFIGAFFPHLKPTSRSISLRIPSYILLRLKERANELNIPYQTLIKQYIARGVLQK